MTWRVIELKNINIYFLHAVEDFIFESANESRTFDDTLILSTLQPGISISSSQNYFLDIDEEACKKDNVPITRRITGGRSMYFDENYLILSVIRRNNDLSTVNNNYQNVLNMIMGALGEVTSRNPLLANANDLMIDGRKIGGASQKSSSNCNLVHCYIRVGDSLERMLKYLKLDGVSLEPYSQELKPFLTSVSEFSDAEIFYDTFKKELLEGKNFYYEMFKPDLVERTQRYMDISYVKGDQSLPSKGHCDIITGSGSQARLNIPSLEGRVKFS